MISVDVIPLLTPKLFPSQSLRFKMSLTENGFIIPIVTSSLTYDTYSCRLTRVAVTGKVTLKIWSFPELFLLFFFVLSFPFCWHENEKRHQRFIQDSKQRSFPHYHIICMVAEINLLHLILQPYLPIQRNHIINITRLRNVSQYANSKNQ